MSTSELGAMLLTKSTEAEIDNAAIDAFASAMKLTMAAHRAKGKCGWHDKERCDSEWLSELLYASLAEGKLVNIASYAMMLHQRGEQLCPAGDSRMALLNATRTMERAYSEIDQARRSSGDPDMRGHAADFIHDADALLTASKMLIVNFPGIPGRTTASTRSLLREAAAALRAEGTSVDLVNRLEVAMRETAGTEMK